MAWISSQEEALSSPWTGRVEATTISIMINGIKSRIPILKATVSSWRTKAGISTYVGTSEKSAGFPSPLKVA